MWQQLSPFLRLVHDFHTPVGFGLEKQQTQDHALHYFAAGSGHYELRGQRYRIEPGRVFLVPPEHEFSFAPDAGMAFHMLNIHFDPVFASDSAATVELFRTRDTPRRPPSLPLFLSSDGQPAFLPASLRLRIPHRFEALFARLEAAFRSDAAQTDIGAGLRARAAFLELLAFLVQSHRATSAQPDAASPQLDSALAFVRAHFAEPLTIAGVAHAVGWSRSQLCAQFKAYTGKSPMRFARELRLERAKSELAFGTCPIKTIARSVGFESLPHFARAFKSYTGTTPARFRAEQGRAVQYGAGAETEV